ncbi:MAG: hypothetical protein JNK16_11575 [Phycisphaerales bacterium]|nr:hypothetical protein [Phycisphaerales bacterium]
MSHEPTEISAPLSTPPHTSSDRHAADALGAITDFEKSIQGLKKLYEERKEIESKLVEAQSKLVANETELASRDQQLERALAKQGEIERTVQLLRAESEAAEAARAEIETALAAARTELEARAKADEERANQTAAESEKSKSLAKELDEFASELAKLQSDLEREKTELETSRSVLLENAKAIKQRETELDSLQNESQAELGARKAEIAAQQAEVAKQQAEVAARRAELDAREKEIAAAHEAAERAASTDSDLARRLAAETEAGDQLRLDVERIARRCAAQEEVLAEYEQLLAVERTHVHSLVSEIQSGDAEPEAMQARIAELKSCLAHEREDRDRLTRKLTELQNQAKAGTQGRTQPASGGSSSLRQRRLKRCRAILREHVAKVRKASEVLAKRFEQCEQVLSQRAQLSAAKRQLDSASAALARRAAGKRAGVLTLCIVLTVAVLGALSWAVVGQAWPGDFEARAEITADGRGRELSDGEFDEWRRALEATLADPQFAETVATRMKQRGYESLGTPVAVRALLTDSFAHDSPSPGTLAVQLRAPGREKASRTLDIITTALASDANASRERRADGAVTLIKAPASASGQPLDDQRLPRTGMVLLGSMLVTCFLGFGIWTKLSRAKQEFELGSQIDQVLDDAKWSEFTAATTVARPNGASNQ